MDNAIKAVAFDMDGTLLDTKVDYAKMSDLLFNEMVLMGVPEHVLDRSGGSKFNIESGTHYLFKNGRENDLYEMQSRINYAATAIEMEHVDLAKPFPGSLDVIKSIKKLGLSVGVLTRGSRPYALKALGNAGVLSEIDALVCRDDYPEKDAKPSPIAMQNLATIMNVECAQIMYLGDHRYDYECALKAGSKFVAVLTGTYDIEDWNRLGNDFTILDSIADLEKLL